MKNKAIKQLLNKLQLLETDTVCFFEQKSKWQSIVSSDVAKKLFKIKPNAFYVFNNQPYILFFDLTATMFQEDREVEIHKQVWSFDQSPLIFILKEKDIEIFNALSYSKRTNRLEKIELEEGQPVESIFSFWKLQSGDTWRWLQEKYYKKNIQEKRVNQKLFENIKAVREALINKTSRQSINEDEANILILRLIFIRYLIDRGVKLDANYINGTTLLERRKSFTELIRQPQKLNSFFEWLNGKFNGVLFKDINVLLSMNIATQLALVFRGELPDEGSLFQGTDYYFEIFDFSIIPVELISGIYESLIDEETRKLHSAVYTPSFLAEYILTNTIDVFFDKPENGSTSECKIFDPSVGSGIFLVQAFRRMVDREIELKGSVTRTRLREIVYNNLFGIDINEQALKVTCFSIYIAMLDYFEPSSILPKFEFPNLIGSNLFKANFFDTTHDFNATIVEKKIDYLLGNPPWKSDKDEIHVKWLKDQKMVVGRYEIAQSFLLRSKDFLHEQTVAALIVTSTIFYNISKTTKKFKQNFLTQFCVNHFFDLSPVRRLIFEEKNSPCAIVFYQKDSGNNYLRNVIKHFSIKSNIFLKYYRTLVIEKIDQKEILQKFFIEHDWMFKVALYGNTLDYLLIKKLLGNRKSIISVIKDNNSLYKGGGIHKGTQDKFEAFTEILNKPIIENSDIEHYYSKAKIDQYITEDDIYIKSGRKSGLFTGKQILLKEQAKNESNIVISISDKEYVFRSGIFVVSSTEKPHEIECVFSYLITMLYEYYIFMISGAWGVSTRPQIRLDEEYLSFPYPDMDLKTKNNLLKLVKAFLKPYQEFYSSFNLGEPQRNENAFNQINTIVEKIYDISGHEKDLINYVLDISRYQFQESKQQKIIRKVQDDEDVLTAYAEVFLQEFDGIYEGEYMQVRVYPLQHFIAMSFEFSEDKPKQQFIICNDNSNELEVLGIIASNLSISKIAKDLYVQKDIKGFEDNSFYIIKPNEYKCWHRAMAWYDVAEFKKSIEESEIDYLNTHLDE